MNIREIRFEDDSIHVRFDAARLADLAAVLAALRSLAGEGELAAAGALPRAADLVAPSPRRREPGDDDEDPAAFPPLAADLPAPSAEELGIAASAAPSATARGGGDGASLPANLAPFRGAGSIRDVLSRLADHGKAAGWGAEEYVRACLDLRGRGACPVLDRVPNLVERVVRSAAILGLATFDPLERADALTDALVARYEAPPA